jgi:hypothetical protein
VGRHRLQNGSKLDVALFSTLSAERMDILQGTAGFQHELHGIRECAKKRSLFVQTT